jgi:hypothetical protein
MAISSAVRTGLLTGARGPNSALRARFTTWLSAPAIVATDGVRISGP